MIHSMTGYAVASADSPRGALNLELRSVNSRFLDLQFRVAEELRAAEPLLRELIGGRITRGKVDCRLSFGNAASPVQPQLNLQAIQQLRNLATEAAKAYPGAAPLRTADVLRWPGVLAEAAIDEERTRTVLADLPRRALDELARRAARRRQLAAALLERARRCASASPRSHRWCQAVASAPRRLAERLRGCWTRASKSVSAPRSRCSRRNPTSTRRSPGSPPTWTRWSACS
jgi:uncharacterized protein (TIGR00255 family)